MAEEIFSPAILDEGLNAGLRKVDFDPSSLGMAPLSLQVLVPGEPCPTDLFLALYDRQSKTVKMQPACAKGEEFRAKWRDNLIKAEQYRVYVRLKDAPSFTSYYDRLVGQILKDPRTSTRKKALVLQEIATLNLRVFFGQDLNPKELETAVNMAEKTVTWMSRDPQLLGSLSEVLQSGYSLYVHSVNVAMMSMSFGRFLKLGEARVHLLGMGGLLHDIGMSKISKEILLKQEALSPEEISLIKKHTLHGYQALMNVSTVPYPVLRIVLDHHERADGSGYPNRLEGLKIPLLVRLISLVDTYEAMTSERPYREPVKPFAAAAALAETNQDSRGKQLVVSFIRFLGSMLASDQNQAPAPPPESS